MSTDPRDHSKSPKRKPAGNSDTGYKRPPKEHQWKPKQSGNPKGRPRKRETRPHEIAGVVSRTLLPKTTRGRMRITAFEVVVQKLFIEAVNGDPNAQAQLLKMREQFEAVRPPPPEPKWRLKRATRFHDGVPVEVIDYPAPEKKDQPATAPRKKLRKHRRSANEAYIDIFDRIARTPVTIGTGGKQKRVSAEYAIWLSLFAGASKGDPKATNLIIRYGKFASKIDVAAEPKTIKYRLNLGDKKVVDPGPKVSFQYKYGE